MSFVGTSREELQKFKETLPAQPKGREYNPVKVGQMYKTSRLGKNTTVIIVGVKKDNVKVKRDEAAKDSFTITRAKLDDYYRLVKDVE